MRARFAVEKGGSWLKGRGRHFQDVARAYQTTMGNCFIRSASQVSCPASEIFTGTTPASRSATSHMGCNGLVAAQKQGSERLRHRLRIRQLRGGPQRYLFSRACAGGTRGSTDRGREAEAIFFLQGRSTQQTIGRHEPCSANHSHLSTMPGTIQDCCGECREKVEVPLWRRLRCRRQSQLQQPNQAAATPISG